MFKGLYPALVTPFKNGELDESAYKKLLKHVLNGGADGVVPNGTTGENPTLSDAERERIIRLAVEIAAEYKVKVIAGAGTNDTARTIKLIEQAAGWGADAALVITPYYNKPTQEGLKRHFRMAAADSPLPLIMYNVPSRTGVNMSVETVVELSAEKNIIGLKEAAGDLLQFAEIVHGCGDKFIMLSGEDGLTLPSLALGCKGVISVAGNVAPRCMKDMLEAWESGNHGKAREFHFRMLPLFKALFLETSPAPCKKALELMGICSSEVRLPLVGVSKGTANRLQRALRGLKIC